MPYIYNRLISDAICKKNQARIFLSMNTYFAVLLHQNVHIDLSTICPKGVHTHTFRYQWKQTDSNCIELSCAERLYTSDYSTP
jgi:hypothetical protein